MVVRHPFGAPSAPASRRPSRPGPGPRRRSARPGFDALESRRLLDGGGPHGGAGTLFDEHEAVMRLIDFDTIHNVSAGGPVSNYFYKAQDSVAAADGSYRWSAVGNWVKEVYDPVAKAFVATPADRIPSNGDDVEVPTGVALTYDLGPGPLPALLPGGASGPGTVTVKTDLRLHSVGIEGSLTFLPNADLVFYFETMVVTPTGALTITETDPAHSARLVIAAPDWSKFSLQQPFDTQLDPFEFARGLISHGKVSMTGENVTPFVTLPSLTKAADNVAGPSKDVPGSFKFTVAAGTATNGWTVGDRIVVTGTNPWAVNPATGASQDEEAVLTGVVANADGSSTFTAQVQTTVTQTSDPKAPPVVLKTLGGLQYDHAPPLDPSGKPYANADGSNKFGVQVADLSRSIMVQSEDPFHTMARGHTMFMHNANVSIAGVGFYGLGRSDKRTVVDDVQLYTKDLIDTLNQAAKLKDPNATPIPYTMIGQFVPGTGLNPRGRYAVHFHRAGINEVDGTDPNNPILKATNPAVVQDSVVVDSPGWGFVNHTSYVNFDNNVAFNVVGASFVTEAGNELGRFTGNLAIKGVGANTGEGIESRKVKQDFGFQGDGFWFQGPTVAVENNTSVSQHHDGFVFFTDNLDQNYSWLVTPAGSTTPQVKTARQGARTTTTILSKFYDPALITALGGLGKSINPGDVPILSFRNNTALGVGTGFESWFHQLGATYDRSLGSKVIGLNVADTRGTGMFDPYTNLLTVKDTTLIGNPARPGGTGMDRNSVTANLTYDNVTVRGFERGVAIPVNGRDVVLGGTYQNKRNFEVTTANSQTRTVLFNDKKSDDGSVTSPLTFPALPVAADEAARINVDLRTTYDPKDRDLTKLFNPDIIRMGTVWLNSFALNGGTGVKQLYYYQQAAGFRPFPKNDEKGKAIDYGGPVYDAYGNIVDYSGVEVPPEILDKTNGELFATFGLSIGGAVAPADAQNGMGTYTFTNGDGSTGTASPRIHGLIGSPSDYQRSLETTSGKYTQKITDPSGAPQYVMGLRFADPSAKSGYTAYQIQVGNFYPASGFTVQLTTLQVNGAAVPIPTPPPNATAAALAQFYKTPLKLPLREGWNLVTGDLDGTGKTRSQLVYGDVTGPDLNLTSPDKYQLRRLTTNGAIPWAPGTWDATPQTMTGVWLGSDPSAPTTAAVTGQYVAVMHPDDLDFGFSLKGHTVDNSFGHRSFEVFITNLKSYLDRSNPATPVPYLTTVGYAGGGATPYASILNYQTFKGTLTTPANGTPPTPVTVVQHLQTIFFAVRDFAGNSKIFALTIYIDPTAPRVGGNANPSGNVNPSASMIGLSTSNGVIYIIDYETWLMITNTKKNT